MQTAIATLERLVAIDSTTEAGSVAAMTFLAAAFGAAGGHLHLYHDARGGRASLFASFGAPELPCGLLFSGHVDVAEPGTGWQTPPFELRRDEGRLYGRGTADMKGFIACVLAVLPELAARATARRLVLCFDHDASVGLLGSQQTASELVARGLVPEIAIVGEPTGMAVIEGHKGVRDVEVRVTGLGSHGGLSEEGVNAVEYAVRYAGQVMQLAAELRLRAPRVSRYDPPWSTLTVNRIAGGDHAFSAAASAELTWELRSVSEEDVAFVLARLRAFEEERLLPEMRARFAEAGLESTVLADVVGLHAVDHNAARDLLVGLAGVADGGGRMGSFATMAGLLQALGTSAVVCGPGGIERIGGPDEYVTEAEMSGCLDMLSGLGAYLEGAADRGGAT